MYIIDHETSFFYGEIGVHRHIPHIKSRGWFDEDYDRNNPDGSACGRRNYEQSAFQAGSGTDYPDVLRPSFDFYRDYAHQHD